MAERRLIDRVLGRPPKADDTAVGRSGTVNTRGFLDDPEQNAKLRWPLNLDVYDKMRRSDPSIRWMLSLLKNPLRAAQWTIEPASDSPEDLEVAAFVDHALFQELDGGFDDFLRQALLFFDFGHSVFERVAAVRQVDFDWKEDHDSDPTEVSREAIVFAKLAPRMPRTINRWITAEGDSSDLKGIEQQLWDGTGSVVIPAERLVVFTHDREGDDFRGTSILRTIYKTWRYKLELENLEAIAYERSAGLPVFYPPPNASETALGQVETAAQNIRQGESLYLIMPGPKAGHTESGEGWLVEELAIKGTGSDATAAIQRYDGAMARNVLAEFMRLGHEQTGARATADVQQNPYQQATEAYAEYIADVISEQVIKPLVGWNYSTTSYPRLTAAALHAKSLDTITAALTGLAAPGFVQADDRMEDWLRELMNAPERPPELARPDPGEEPPAPPQGPGQPPQKPEPSGSTFTMSNVRERHPAEAHVAFSEIVEFLDESEAKITDATDRTLAPLIDAAESVLDTAVDARNPELVSTLSVPTGTLATTLGDLVQGFYDEGRRQVAAECRRQSRERFDYPPEVTHQLPEVIAARAKTAAESITSQATRALRNLGLRRLEAPESPHVNADTLGLDARAAARGAAKSAARPLVMAAFNLGRKDEMVETIKPVPPESPDRLAS
jgi:hypothetical protein